MAELEFGGEIDMATFTVQIVESNLYQFYKRNGFATLADLMKRATEDVGWFWDAMLRTMDVQFYEPYSQKSWTCQKAFNFRNGVWAGK